jgi:anti-sigma regulatory factor (Ser/Thr protein kinase)
MTLRYVITPDAECVGEAADDLKAALERLGVKERVSRKIFVVMYEAAVNMAIHAGGGVAEVEILPGAVRLRFVDNGSGIADVKRAMLKGFSTAPDNMRRMGFGGGMGLYNIWKNADSLNITAEEGGGSTVEVEVRL